MDFLKIQTFKCYFFMSQLDDRGRVQWLGVMSSGHKPRGRRRDLETPGPWLGGGYSPLCTHSSNPASSRVALLEVGGSVWLEPLMPHSWRRLSLGAH